MVAFVDVSESSPSKIQTVSSNGYEFGSQMFIKSNGIPVSTLTQPMAKKKSFPLILFSFFKRKLFTQCLFVFRFLLWMIYEYYQSVELEAKLRLNYKFTIIQNITLNHKCVKIITVFTVVLNSRSAIYFTHSCVCGKHKNVKKNISLIVISDE